MEVWVEETPKRALLGTPKRTSLPVVFPVGWWMRPAACTAGLGWASAATANPTQHPKMMVMAASTARPWRTAPTIFPKT